MAVLIRGKDFGVSHKEFPGASNWILRMSVFSEKQALVP